MSHGRKSSQEETDYPFIYCFAQDDEELSGLVAGSISAGAVALVLEKCHLLWNLVALLLTGWDIQSHKSERGRASSSTQLDVALEIVLMPLRSPGSWL